MLYVSLIVTTEQKPAVDSQKRKSRKSKNTTMENHRFTKEGNKTRRKKQGTTKWPENNRKRLVKSLPVHIYSKCKWIEFSNQKSG